MNRDGQGENSSKTSSAYDTRFRHKLNMLEPGSRMLACAAILAGIGLLCSAVSWTIAANLLYICAGAVTLVLFVLVGVELRQDRILNQIAQEERRQEDSHWH